MHPPLYINYVLVSVAEIRSNLYWSLIGDEDLARVPKKFRTAVG